MTDDIVQRPPHLPEIIREMAYQVAGAALGIALRDNPNYVMPTKEAGEETERILRDFGFFTPPGAESLDERVERLEEELEETNKAIEGKRNEEGP